MFISLRSLIIQFHSIQLIDWNGLIHWTRYIPLHFTKSFHCASLPLHYIPLGSLHVSLRFIYIHLIPFRYITLHFIPLNFIPFHFVRFISAPFHSSFTPHFVLRFVFRFIIRSMKTQRSLRLRVASIHTSLHSLLISSIPFTSWIYYNGNGIYC